MPSGPSKQELEMYWANSRQYFDQLAEHYKKADPAYYKEYIEPFYNNPFNTASSSSGGKTSGGCGAKMVLVIAVFMLFGIGGAAVFYFLYNSAEQKNDPTEPKPKEKIEKKIEPEDKKNTDPDINNKQDNEKGPDGLTPEDNFIIGSKALGEKDYDKAEKHLKQIKPGDKYYKEAQQLLESMTFLRKYDK